MHPAYRFPVRVTTGCSTGHLRTNRSHATVLRQFVELIPGHLVPTFARECGIHLQARLFSAWSHLVSMLYAQISRSHGRNELCDSLSFHLSDLLAMRGATAPMRNTLSV